MTLFSRLRELEKDATDAPWQWTVDGPICELVGPRTIAEGCSSQITEFNNHIDAQMIAVVRNQLPKVFEVLDLYEAALDELTNIDSPPYKIAEDALKRAKEIAGE